MDILTVFGTKARKTWTFCCYLTYAHTVFVSFFRNFAD